MHAVTFTHRAFFSYDVRPEALLGILRAPKPVDGADRRVLVERHTASAVYPRAPRVHADQVRCTVSSAAPAPVVTTT